ncbi:hypothetical protein [Amycolatopsis vancoresmycina]|uniref:Uncharacterized protein n=1 Tax=Amycolatopsis vancoresmycina DSM 44592 TaxID=1292037 RepID=R1I4A9_9PSEU|nr:hypothetical protein [Amycolatopsis vancoresmycina]EOD67346.1 hypothetical protein H480_16965 [Amycolatopsis vancoresmycina DSM 44592]
MTTPPTDRARTRQLSVHEFLTARGWHLDGESDPAEVRFADDVHAGWHYPATYGGQRINEVADTTPVPLQGCFTFGDEGEEVFSVTPAGNLRGSGCAEHDTQERCFPLTAEGAVDLTEIAPLLDTLEPRARALDPRELIECRYFGPCER